MRPDFAPIVSRYIGGGAGFSLEPIRLGESGASVWRCTREDGFGAPTLYVKSAPLAAELRLDGEAERLAWMRAHELPVPAVLEYHRDDATEFFITEAVLGAPASDRAWRAVLPAVIDALGRGLARIHRTTVAGCPFDERLARQVERVRARIAAGQVRQDDFDDVRAGRTATDLFAELVATMPRDEDLVFVHGDFCLPNVVLDRATNDEVRIAGLIDCGRAGVADRHQDLALAVRSITYNFGPEHVTPFLNAYGLSGPRPEKLEFFMLLDEFF